MQSIDFNDVMVATVVQGGTTLFSLRLSGVCSMADVLKCVKASMKHVAGMVSLTLRNVSQGWSKNQALFMGSAPRLKVRQSVVAQNSTPVQLTLF